MPPLVATFADGNFSVFAASDPLSAPEVIHSQATLPRLRSPDEMPGERPWSNFDFDRVAEGCRRVGLSSGTGSMM